jgi:hypothetical protein
MATLVSSLSRLRAAAAETNTAFAAAGGDDGVNASLLSYVFSTLPSECWAAPEAELILVVNPRTIFVHCSAFAWEAGIGAALEDAGGGAESDLGVEAYVPAPGVSADEAADFKLESLRAMLGSAAGEAARVLAGGRLVLPPSPDEEVGAGWPLLQIATSEAPPWPTGSAITPSDVDVSAARRQLQRAMRSVDAAALAPEGWVGSCVRAVRAGWGGWLERVGKAGGAYERQGMTEVGLTDAILSAMTKALASRDVDAGKASGKSVAGKAGALVVPSAAAAGAVTTFLPLSPSDLPLSPSDLPLPPPLAPTTAPMQKAEEKGMSTGVWAGSGTSAFGSAAPRKRQLRLCGTASVPALHLIVRLAGVLA